MPFNLTRTVNVIDFWNVIDLSGIYAGVHGCIL